MSVATIVRFYHKKMSHCPLSAVSRIASSTTRTSVFGKLKADMDVVRAIIDFAGVTEDDVSCRHASLLRVCESVF